MAGSVWLEKNNGGWGPITILRVNLKSACKTFFSGEFSSWIVGIGGLCLGTRVDLGPFFPGWMGC